MLFVNVEQEDEEKTLLKSQISHTLIFSLRNKNKQHSQQLLLPYYKKTITRDTRLINHLLNCEFECQDCSKIYDKQTIDKLRIFHKEYRFELELKYAAEFYSFEILCKYCFYNYSIYWKDYKDFSVMVCMKRSDTFQYPERCDYARSCILHGPKRCYKFGSCQSCIPTFFRVMTKFWKDGPYPFNTNIVCTC